MPEVDYEAVYWDVLARVSTKRSWGARELMDMLNERAVANRIPAAMRDFDGRSLSEGEVQEHMGQARPYAPEGGMRVVPGTR